MLKNLVGIVTGGASGLGKAAATKLVQEGCKVTICDLPNSSGMKVAESLMPIGPETSFSATDVRSHGEVERMFEDLMRKYGKIDFVVNCAGVACAHKTYNYFSSKLHDIVKFQNVIDTNVKGTFNIARYAAKYIGQNKCDEDGLSGTIINLAGIEAFNGQTGQTAVSAASGGIVAMTLPLARDLSERGIRVVCICTGVFDTPLTAGMPDKVKYFLGQACIGPKRLGKPEEFGDAVKFVLENHYVNATVLHINGGMYLYYG